MRRCRRRGSLNRRRHGEPGQLYDLPLAIRRIKAARAAIDGKKVQVLLVARAECYLVGHPEPLKDALKRLTAYAAAGADVLYAPGPRTREEIREIVRAVAPQPSNAIVMVNFGITVAELADLACGESASARRSRARRGAHSSGRRKRSGRRGVSRALMMPRRFSF